MEEHFINYNQALALKELGFNEKCFAAYRDSEWIGHDGPNSRYFHAQLFSNSMFDDDQPEYCSSPLKSQVFKWFRKNHSINGIVSYYGKGQWNIEILDYKGNELIQIEDNTFWSYEEAESACIDKLISIIKEKK